MSAATVARPGFFGKSLFGTGLKERLGPVDPVLAAVVVGLLGFGLVMVYSASVIEAAIVYRDGEYFLKRQAIYVALALLVMGVVSRIDYRLLRKLTYPLLGAVVVLMVMSVVGFGHSGGGAARWLRIGPFHIQPSEAAKLALVLWLGYSLEKKKELIKSVSIGLLPHLLIAGVLMVLCLKQPDFGGAVVLFFLTLSMLFVAGARVGYLLAIATVAGAMSYTLVRFTSYRMARMMAWYKMDEHRRDLAYQPFQSVMSFGSGEVGGLGIGKGLQVLYLPESWTDFVSAIIGEELGFIGILALVLVFVVIVVRGVQIAMRAPDEYGAYIAFGIAMLFGAQAMVNLSVAMAMLPTKGLTLPFVSFGGSSLLVSAAAMGVLLSVSRQRTPIVNKRVDGEPAPDSSIAFGTGVAFGSGAGLGSGAPRGVGGTR